MYATKLDRDWTIKQPRNISEAMELSFYPGVGRDHHCWGQYLLNYSRKYLNNQGIAKLRVVLFLSTQPCWPCCWPAGGGADNGEEEIAHYKVAVE